VADTDPGPGPRHRGHRRRHTAEVAAAAALGDRPASSRHPAPRPAPYRPGGPLGTADRVHLEYGVTAEPEPDGTGRWRCTAWLLASFTVDADDASWPAEHFAVDIVPAAIHTPRLRGIHADTLSIIRRTPTRRRPHRHTCT
jgi:hypothetical protein